MSAPDISGSDIKEPVEPKNPVIDVIVPEVRTGVHAAVPAGKPTLQPMDAAQRKSQASTGLGSIQLSPRTFDLLEYVERYHVTV